MVHGDNHGDATCDIAALIACDDDHNSIVGTTLAKKIITYHVS